jgi:effector-binding domain-containing protein
MTRTYEIESADLQEQQVALVRGRIRLTDIPAFLETALTSCPGVAVREGLRLTGPPYARYRFLDDDTIDIDAGFPVSGPVVRAGGVEPGFLPGGHVVTTVHVGAYEDVGAAYEALERYLVENGYEPAGTAWECYLDEPHVPEPRTKIFLPARRVRPRARR